jgi:hypothetical protein
MFQVEKVIFPLDNCRFQSEHGLSPRQVYDEETRSILIATIESLKQTIAASEAPSTSAVNSHSDADEIKEVVITDIDGDVMRFCLSEDKARVIEYVNDALELDSVSSIIIDDKKGVVRDAKGSFVVKEEERVSKLGALRSLLARVGVSATTAPAPAATVEIDLDMSGNPEQLMEQQKMAGEAIRRACAHLGASPDAARNIFSHLFEAITSATEAAGASETKPAADSTEHGDGIVGGVGDALTSENYQQQLLDILDMGFNDVELISTLLAKHEGNISHVITDLTEMSMV